MCLLISGCLNPAILLLLCAPSVFPPQTERLFIAIHSIDDFKYKTLFISSFAFLYYLFSLCRYFHLPVNPPQKLPSLLSDIRKSSGHSIHAVPNQLNFTLGDGEIMSSKNSNQINVPEAREAMEQFKMEAAKEMGVNLKKGYNGDLTSREAGSVGGQMVKKMIEAYERGM